MPARCGTIEPTSRPHSLLPCGRHAEGIRRSPPGAPLPGRRDADLPGPVAGRGRAPAAPHRRPGDARALHQAPHPPRRGAHLALLPAPLRGLRHPAHAHLPGGAAGGGAGGGGLHPGPDRLLLPLRVPLRLPHPGGLLRRPRPPVPAQLPPLRPRPGQLAGLLRAPGAPAADRGRRDRGAGAGLPDRDAPLERALPGGVRRRRPGPLRIVRLRLPRPGHHGADGVPGAAPRHRRRDRGPPRPGAREDLPGGAGPAASSGAGARSSPSGSR